MNTIRLVLSVLMLSGPAAGSAWAKIDIVAATNDLAAVAAAVGGGHVALEVVARPDRDPHTVDVRPRTMRKTSRADLYLEVGMSLDLWSKDIVRGSRNRDLVVVDCSEAIEALEVPEGPVDASMGDIHPEGNPHYWLDPMNAIEVAAFLADTFARVDPDNAEAFQRNAHSFIEDVSARMPAWREQLEGRSFVEFHRTWVYLARRFDMTIVDQVEPLPGIPPTARHLAELAETIRRTGVPIVVRDVYHDDSAVDFLERETDIRGVLLKASCDEPTPESFMAHYDRIARVLGGSAGDEP